MSKYTHLLTTVNTGSAEKTEELIIEKKDENGLPTFVRNIPVSTRKKKKADGVFIEYRWPEYSADKAADETITDETIHVSTIEFKDGEQLDNTYRLNNANKGETLILDRGHFLYIIRKTTEKIAKALYRACLNVKTDLERIAGYLKTTLGEWYVISHIDKKIWGFDPKIANGEISHISIENLDGLQKKTLAELVVKKTIKLHCSRLLIKNWSLGNLLLSDKDAIFTDLRSLRAVRKQTRLVEEFIVLLQYLFTNKIADNSDIYHAIAMYSTSLNEPCMQWSKEKRKNSKSHYGMVLEIEKEVYA